MGRPDLPVMRLVQAAVAPDPRPQHLAEVILSGMLTAVPGAPPGSYAFREGVRELLLLGLPRTERHRTTELLDRMGEFIDRRAGRAPGEFRATVPLRTGYGAGRGGRPVRHPQHGQRATAGGGRHTRGPPSPSPSSARSTRRATAVPSPSRSPTRRAVLCMLLLREGRPATRDELSAGVWDGPVPLVPGGLLNAHVARLRDRLGPDVPDRGRDRLRPPRR